jgi:hypothetical protein
MDDAAQVIVFVMASVTKCGRVGFKQMFCALGVRIMAGCALPGNNGFMLLRGLISDARLIMAFETEFRHGIGEQFSAVFRAMRIMAKRAERSGCSKMKIWFRRDLFAVMTLETEIRHRVAQKSDTVRGMGIVT